MPALEDRELEEQAQRMVRDGWAVDLFTARTMTATTAARKSTEADDGAQRPRTDDARHAQG